jgi:hypothetical protein
MDDLARYSIECSLQDGFAIASAVNRSEPLVRLTYAKGCATFACDSHPRELERRVVAAQAEVLAEPRVAAA